MCRDREQFFHNYILLAPSFQLLIALINGLVVSGRANPTMWSLYITEVEPRVLPLRTGLVAGWTECSKQVVPRGQAATSHMSAVDPQAQSSPHRASSFVVSALPSLLSLGSHMLRLQGLGLSLDGSVSQSGPQVPFTHSWAALWTATYGHTLHSYFSLWLRGRDAWGTWLSWCHRNH